MIRLLTICASPTVGSSTEILLRTIEKSIVDDIIVDRVAKSFVRLNDLDFIPCQACGEAPPPRFCFIDDDLTAVHKKLARCDCLLFGSPVFFDSVSAQAKMFIDRCNCFRPPAFGDVNSDHSFARLLTRKRPGGMVLVGGQRGRFEDARRCIAGFFKWVEVVNEGMVTYCTVDFQRTGEVQNYPDKLRNADQLGRRLARKLNQQHA